MLKHDKELWKQYSKEPKVLILGSSDSGKTTLLKQIRLLHGNGFSSSDLQTARQTIKDNIVTAIQKLLQLQTDKNLLAV